MRRTRPRPERGAAARSRRRPDPRRPGPRVQADLGCRAGTRPRPRANRRSDPQGCGRGAQCTDKAPGPRPVITPRRFRALGVRTKSAFLGSLGLGPKSIWLVIASSSTLLAAARRRRKQTVVSAGTGASGKGRALSVRFACWGREGGCAVRASVIADVTGFGGRPHLLLGPCGGL